MNIYDTQEYADIVVYYGQLRAKRSGVKLINHINEGLELLEHLDAHIDAKKAFCLHPIFQNDTDFLLNYGRIFEYSRPVISLVMEYRNKANSYLCVEQTDDYNVATINHCIGSLHPQVRLMLIADKIQNKKDFDIYHLGTHSRSTKLSNYFHNWLVLLDVWGEHTPLIKLITKEGECD